jgi:transposase
MDRVSEMKPAKELRARFLRETFHILAQRVIGLEASRQIGAAGHERSLARLQTVSGVGPRTAEVVMAEVGRDMSRFPSHRHLASWAGLCPGNNESAGKRKSGKTRKGSPWLRE